MVVKYGSAEGKEESSEEGSSGTLFKRRSWYSPSQNVIYGLGHVYNDLCAAMWFSYMMLFFQVVLEMKAVVAGTMLLLGQVVDALATPIVGLLADRYSTKKTWHLIGCILVSCTFPLLFVRCWRCWVSAERGYLQWWMPLYYAILITIFQIGWAVVQISHLAMIPSISNSAKVRSELTSIRYMASVASSLGVYLITWVVLKSSNYSSNIGPTDDYKFKDVATIISGIGIFSYVLFHICFNSLTKSNKEVESETSDGAEPLLAEKTESGSSLPIKSTLTHFIRLPMLYVTSLLYVFSRLYWALSLVYVPLFLEERLSLNPDTGSELVASVPFVLYIASLLTSLVLKSRISSCGNQLAYFLGSLVSLTSSLWIASFINPRVGIPQIYLVAALIGIGSSMTLVSSLCATADLIGSHTHQCAAIYSIVTFTDKLVTGIAVVTIENYKCSTRSECPQYYRGVLIYACGGCALLGIASAVLMRLLPKDNK